LISIVLVLVIGLLAGGWLTRKLLPRLAERTPTDLDDALVEVAGSNLRWLILVMTANVQTRRLTFLSAGLKTLVGDAAFIINLALVFRILWRSIAVADKWFRDKSAEEDREQDVGPLITLLARLGRIGLVFAAGSLLLSRFGIDVSVLAIALGVGGLAVSLASRDIIADFIAGFIIQIDRPFRVGDRIEIQGVGTWGDVVDIGLRSTRIRTRDNRMVIVPNGIIGSNQVVNYTYPDPQYRIETHIGVAYGTDIERARRIIIDTVRHVEGVLPDKPVDALYIEMGPSSMVFRVRWWIDSYIDTRRMLDRMHTALQESLDDASVEMPYPTQTLQIQMPLKTDQQLLKPSGALDARTPGAGVPDD
jgi:small-conductance mechanosensitive channel